MQINHEGWLGNCHCFSAGDSREDSVEVNKDVHHNVNEVLPTMTQFKRFCSSSLSSLFERGASTTRRNPILPLSTLIISTLRIHATGHATATIHLNEMLASGHTCLRGLSPLPQREQSFQCGQERQWVPPEACGSDPIYSSCLCIGYLLGEQSTFSSSEAPDFHVYGQMCNSLKRFLWLTRASKYFTEL